MAHYAKPISFLFLIFISTSLLVEAREKVFFSKATHRNVVKTETPLSAPSPAPAPATEIKPSATSNGYGLYGQESNEFPPAKTTTTTAAAATTTVFPDDGKDFQTEELSENYEKEETGYTYNNNNNNNNNGYSNNQNYYNANGYANNYNGNSNGYASHEKQGMSDTRFLENGKYYYNAKSENYYSGNGYESERGSGNSEGYYNGNGENEFDSMEEYERQQGYYPQSQGEYIP